VAEKDSTDSQWSNATARDFLTQGTIEVATMVGELQRKTKIVLVKSNGIGKAQYALPSNWYAVTGVLIKKNVDFQPLVPKEIGALGDTLKGFVSNATQPVQYAVSADTISVFPADKISDGDTLYVYYTLKPNTLDSNSQTTQLPFWTDELVLDYAVMRARSKDMGFSEYQAWWQWFEARVDKKRNQYIRRPEERTEPLIK
jgi:hypothetical protein